MDGDENSLLAKKARNKMLLFYLLQLFKTNPTYSLKELLKMFSKNPDMLLSRKFYRKIIKAIFA
jgi:hypothetical protein